jgi:AraC-like DNA-binding protein
MAAQVSEADAPIGSGFSTADPDLVVDYIEKMYHTVLQLSAVRVGHVFVHRRLDGGSFALEDVRLPLTLCARQDPFDFLGVVTTHAGRFERNCGGIDEQFQPGDIFIADPALPSTLRTVDLHAQAMVLDLPVLTQVANTAPTRKPGPIRFTGFQPVSRGAATGWTSTISYLTELLINTEAIAQPLIRGTAARLLAATALATFPNTAVTEPTSQDRRDATSATVRRAIAYIEQHPNADVSVADIAAAANVSIRTVQFAFRRYLHVTPMEYLRRVRLDRVHSELLAADPFGDTTVTDIATRWGFCNHSRFAARYRRAYGATPHDTLRSG